MQGTYWASTFILAAAASLFADAIKDIKVPASVSTQAAVDIASNVNDEQVTTNAPTGWWDATGGAVVEFFASFSAAGYTFFILAVVSAFFFAYTAWVKSLRENFIFQTIQTNPPQGFWGRYEEAVLDTREIYTSIQKTVFQEKVSKADIKDCELGVRAILDHIINLVMMWDTANIERKVVYRANVMDVVYFKEKGVYALGQDIKFPNDSTEKERKSVLHSLDRFLHQPMLSHYSGVVVLNDNRYTTTTATEGSLPDGTINPIALPFCLDKDNDIHKFHSNLRGAPYAVATDAPDYVETVTKIISHYSDHADPKSKRIKANLKEYYALKGNPAQSILSIPLRVNTESGGLKVRWVLNIYRNQSGMLYNQEKNKQFTQIVSSITTPLQVILDMIDGAEVTKGDKPDKEEPVTEQGVTEQGVTEHS